MQDRARRTAPREEWEAAMTAELFLLLCIITLFFGFLFLNLCTRKD